MRNILLLASLISIMLISCSPKIAGIYVGDSDGYGHLAKNLTLNCTGDVSLKFEDKSASNQNAYGSWKVQDKTLIISFDSLENLKLKSKTDYKFSLEGRNLKKISYVAADTSVTITSNNSLKSLSSINSENVVLKIGGQYFRKAKSIKCK